MLAGRLGLPRQKINYHLKELERHGLVELVEERRKGNVTERIYGATAAAYVISPSAMGAVSPDPDRSPDRLSARWLLALGSRLIQEVGTLLTGSARAGKPVATYAMDAQVRFASADDRAAFAEELTQAVLRPGQPLPRRARPARPGPPAGRRTPPDPDGAARRTDHPDHPDHPDRTTAGCRERAAARP